MGAGKHTRGGSEMAMRPAPRVWPGWIGTLPAHDTKYRFTWDEWCTRLHQQRQQRERPQRAPRRGDVAARAFLAWSDAAGAGSDRPTPSFDDRELAVRRFMRSFEEAAATLDQFSATELARLRLLRWRHQAG